MRVTQNMSTNNSVYNIQKGAAKLDKLQNQAASGLNINTPSDDPITAKLLVDIGDKLKYIDQYSSNIQKASSWLKFTSTAMSGMSDIINLARKIAGTINNGSDDPNIRQSAHDQLVDLKKQFVDMANSQYGDQYVFGGANNSTPPFSNDSNDYNGDATMLEIRISDNSSISLNITGDRLVKGGGTAPNYGATDILAAFDDMIAAVGDNSTPSNVTAISQGAVKLQDGTKQLNIAVSDILSRTARLDNMGKLNDNNRNTLLSIATRVQEVDYAKLGVELSKQKMAFEASLSSTAKLQSLSLLNYM